MEFVNEIMFTDTIKTVASLSSATLARTSITVKNYEIFEFSALAPSGDKPVGYSKSYAFLKNIKVSPKYAYKAVISFSGTCNDYAEINVKLGESTLSYSSPMNVFFGGCYSSINPDGTIHDYVNFQKESNISLNSNVFSVLIIQHGSCALRTDINVKGTITIYYK